MELRPRNEAELHAALIGMWGPRWAFLLMTLPLSVGGAFPLLVATVGQHPPVASVAIVLILGALVGFVLWRKSLSAPAGHAFRDHFIRADENGLQIKGQARGATMEVRFRWDDIQRIEFGRPAQLPGIVHAAESQAMVIREKGGENIKFDLIGIVFAPEDLARFYEFAASHIVPLLPSSTVQKPNHFPEPTRRAVH